MYLFNWGEITTTALSQQWYTINFGQPLTFRKVCTVQYKVTAPWLPQKGSYDIWPLAKSSKVQRIALEVTDLRLQTQHIQTMQQQQIQQRLRDKHPHLILEIDFKIYLHYCILAYNCQEICLGLFQSNQSPRGVIGEERLLHKKYFLTFFCLTSSWNTALCDTILPVAVDFLFVVLNYYLYLLTKLSRSSLCGYFLSNSTASSSRYCSNGSLFCTDTFNSHALITWQPYKSNVFITKTNWYRGL